ncbi:MAG: N-acetylmuramoyl-L-alanine amidase [Flavobacteriales bacterium]|nr:N-acetylmuramoyl-L-alanine amidase [Flavobacteriales bacterium]
MTNPRKKSFTWTAQRLIPVFLLTGVLFIAAITPAPRNPATTFTVVIDAGHGGKDPGNLGTGRYKTTEKDIALDVVLMLGNYIKENYPEVEVLYTRKDDSYPTLERRTEIANNAQADLFISVHLNAAENKAAFGAETFVMGLHKSEESLRTAMKENSTIFLEENHEKNYAGFDPKNPDTYIALSLRENVYMDNSLVLAKTIQDQFRTRAGRKDRGVKQAGFLVISYTNMPSVLVELGFMTNETEEDFIQGADGKTYMASALFRAFKEYKAKLDNTVVSDKLSTKPEATPAPDTPIVLPDRQAGIGTPNQKLSNSSTIAIIWRDVPKEEVCYKVQILTSSKPLDKKAADFKNLERVDEYISNGVYKYMAGCTQSYKEVKTIQQNLRTLGFTDAFVVAFENGKKIELSAAIGKTQ